MKNRIDKGDFAAGASVSLNKTIKGIMKFLEDDDDRPPRKFHTFLYKKIADSNELWLGEASIGG
jgi:hypothetical protein